MVLQWAAGSLPPVCAACQVVQGHVKVVRQSDQGFILRIIVSCFKLLKRAASYPNIFRKLGLGFFVLFT